MSQLTPTHSGRRRLNQTNRFKMDHLPLGDIPMLVSCINFLLRDEEFENLDQICYCFNVEREEMDRILASGGYKYRPEQNSVLWLET